MELINCKIEYGKSIVFWPATGADNANAIFNDIIFTIEDTKLYVPVITLTTKDNEKHKIICSCNHINSKKQ